MLRLVMCVVYYIWYMPRGDTLFSKAELTHVSVSSEAGFEKSKKFARRMSAASRGRYRTKV